MSDSLQFRAAKWIVGGVLALVGAVTPVRADDFQVLDDPAQIDEMTAAVQRTSNSLCWEMHRFHRQQPGFPEAYRQAKEVWSMAGTLRDALRAGTIDPATLNNQVARMNDALTQVEKTTEGWGDGVRPAITPADERPVVVTPGRVNVDIPLLFGGGISVGSPPRVVAADPDPVTLPRRRFHPNTHGSRRSLERELASVRTAMDYLAEDTGTGAVPAATTPTAPPKPMPPDEAATGPQLSPPTKISPPAGKTSATEEKK
jgi:hypothetical protein